jgi:hypothetical protein
VTPSLALAEYRAAHLEAADNAEGVDFPGMYG